MRSIRAARHSLACLLRDGVRIVARARGALPEAPESPDLSGCDTPPARTLRRGDVKNSSFAPDFVLSRQTSNLMFMMQVYTKRDD
jgi:hypothetical protein